MGPGPGDFIDGYSALAITAAVGIGWFFVVRPLAFAARQSIRRRRCARELADAHRATTALPFLRPRLEPRCADDVAAPADMYEVRDRYPRLVSRDTSPLMDAVIDTQRRQRIH